MILLIDGIRFLLYDNEYLQLALFEFLQADKMKRKYMFLRNENDDVKRTIRTDFNESTKTSKICRRRTQQCHQKER